VRSLSMIVPTALVSAPVTLTRFERLMFTVSSDSLSESLLVETLIDLFHRK